MHHPVGANSRTGQVFVQKVTKNVIQDGHETVVQKLGLGIGDPCYAK